MSHPDQMDSGAFWNGIRHLLLYEGVGNLFYDDIGYSGKDYGTEVDPEYGIAKEQFAWLWDSTIKKADLDCYGWDANPRVWVIEFERCEKPAGPWD